MENINILNVQADPDKNLLYSTTVLMSAYVEYPSQFDRFIFKEPSVAVKKKRLSGASKRKLKKQRLAEQVLKTRIENKPKKAGKKKSKPVQEEIKPVQIEMKPVQKLEETAKQKKNRKRLERRMRSKVLKAAAGTTAPPTVENINQQQPTITKTKVDQTLLSKQFNSQPNVKKMNKNVLATKNVIKIESFNANSRENMSRFSGMNQPMGTQLNIALRGNTSNFSNTGQRNQSSGSTQNLSTYNTTFLPNMESQTWNQSHRENSNTTSLFARRMINQPQSGSSVTSTQNIWSNRERSPVRDRSPFRKEERSYNPEMSSRNSMRSYDNDNTSHDYNPEYFKRDMDQRDYRSRSIERDDRYQRCYPDKQDYRDMDRYSRYEEDNRYTSGNYSRDGSNASSLDPITQNRGLQNYRRSPSPLNRRGMNMGSNRSMSPHGDAYNRRYDSPGRNNYERSVSPVSLHDYRDGFANRNQYDERPMSSPENSNMMSYPAGPSQMSKPINDDKPIEVTVINARGQDQILSRAEAAEFQTLVMRHIDSLPNGEFCPRFRNSRYRRGVLQFLCYDVETAQWLKHLVLTTKPFKHIDLQVMEKGQFVTHQIFNIWIPGSTGCDPVKVLQRMEKQNPGLDTSKWKVLDTKNHDNKSMKITISVDGTSLPILVQNGFRLFMNLKRVHFKPLPKSRFYKK